MGFFKNLKNKVTGGAAVITVQVGTGQRGQAFPIQVQAVAKADGKVAAVYLLIRATESCEFKDQNNNTVQGTCVSYENKVTISGATELKDGQTYDWQGMLELPTNTNPSFRGSMIDHEWEVQAGLDMPGNDPDSGWVTIEVE